MIVTLYTLTRVYHHIGTGSINFLGRHCGNGGDGRLLAWVKEVDLGHPQWDQPCLLHDVCLEWTTQTARSQEQVEANVEDERS